MTENDVKKYTSDELSKQDLSELISQKKSFKVVAVKNISFCVNKIEGAIEKQGLKCRSYTEYRSSTLAGWLIPTGVTQVAAAFSAIGIAAHRLATYDPDYEIAKNKFNNTVTVTYKKQ